MMLPNRNRPPVTAGRAAGIGNFQHAQYTTENPVSAIVSALSLKTCGKQSWQGNCPSCGYADAFSLTVKDGKPLWHCHACGDGEGIQLCLQAQGLLGGRRESFSFVRRFQPMQRVQKEADPGKRDYARKLWAGSLPITDTVAADYLHGRGLVGPYPAALRFLPDCPHTPTGQKHPTIIAAGMRWPDAKLIAIHRTYLKPDGSGKIDHPQARMMLGDATGGAVQLAPAAERMGVAEGIETALSVQQETGLPMWACLSTSGLQNVMLPDIVREVVICADNDAPGLKAAHAAADRLSLLGKQVRIALPPQAGHDFNDILKGASHE